MCHSLCHQFFTGRFYPCKKLCQPSFFYIYAIHLKLIFINKYIRRTESAHAISGFCQDLGKHSAHRTFSICPTDVYQWDFILYIAKFCHQILNTGQPQLTAVFLCFFQEIHCVYIIHCLFHTPFSVTRYSTGKSFSSVGS